MNICDLIMLESKYMWHAADTFIPENETRFSGVLTTHSGFINKFL